MAHRGTPIFGEPFQRHNYALFHTILTAAADDLVGQKHRQTPRYELIYRSVDHNRLRSVCQAVVEMESARSKKEEEKKGKYAKYRPKGGFGQDLASVATVTVDLYEKRQLADYNPHFHVRRLDATLAIEASRVAIDRFKGVPRASKEVFLSLVIVSPR